MFQCECLPGYPPTEYSIMLQLLGDCSNMRHKFLDARVQIPYICNTVFFKKKKSRQTLSGFYKDITRQLPSIAASTNIPLRRLINAKTPPPSIPPSLCTTVDEIHPAIPTQIQVAKSFKQSAYVFCQPFFLSTE